MSKEIAKEELRSNYLSFLQPFLEAEAARIDEILRNDKPDKPEPSMESAEENSKKRKLTDGEDEAVEKKPEDKSSDEEASQNTALSPSKKRKLGDLLGTAGRPLWEEVKSRSFAKGMNNS